MKLTCPAGRVIVQPDPEHAASQLVIPAEYKKYSDRGTVIAVGGGRRHINGEIYPLEHKVGDRVVFARNGAYAIESNGVKLYSCESEAIVAKMEADNSESN